VRGQERTWDHLVHFAQLRPARLFARLTAMADVEMQSLQVRPPIIMLRHGKRGVMVSTSRKSDDYAKGLLAITASGPRPGDVVIDSTLRRFQVASSSNAAGVLDRLRSIVSPRPIHYAVIFEAPEAISLAEVKSSIVAAMNSSSTVQEYWNETSITLEERLSAVANARSFSDLCDALRH
jgi:hypothetical protein